MRRFVPATLLAVAVACLVPSASTADEKKENRVVLKTILSVEHTFSKGKKKLSLTVVGEVPTGGWKDAKLTRRPTKEAPKDGIYDYELTALRPTGIVTQVISKVTAEDTWENPPADIKGVRVHGTGDGVKTVKFEK